MRPARRRLVAEVTAVEGERFRALFDTSFDGVLVHDGGVIIAANRALADLLRFDDPSALVGEPILRFVVPEDQPEVVVRNTNASDAAYDVVAVRGDGSRFRAQLRGRTFEHEGRTLRIGCVRDATDARRREQEAADAERQFQDLFENAFEPLFLLDLAGRFTAVNRSAQAVMGYGEADVVGKPSIDFVAPEAREAVAEEMRRKLDIEAGESRYSTTWLGRDGRRVEVDIYTTVVRRAGERVGILGAARVMGETTSEEES